MYYVETRNFRLTWTLKDQPSVRAAYPWTPQPPTKRPMRIPSAKPQPSRATEVFIALKFPFEFLWKPFRACAGVGCLFRRVGLWQLRILTWSPSSALTTLGCSLSCKSATACQSFLQAQKTRLPHKGFNRGQGIRATRPSVLSFLVRTLVQMPWRLPS